VTVEERGGLLELEPVDRCELRERRELDGRDESFLRMERVIEPPRGSERSDQPARQPPHQKREPRDEPGSWAHPGSELSKRCGDRDRDARDERHGERAEGDVDRDPHVVISAIPADLFRDGAWQVFWRQPTHPTLEILSGRFFFTYVVLGPDLPYCTWRRCGET
jgi:hypothetical protein